MSGILLRRADRDAHTEKMAMERQAEIGEMLGIASSWSKLGARPGTFSLGGFGRNKHRRPRSLSLLDFRTVKEVISAVSGHPGWGNSFHKP